MGTLLQKVYDKFFVKASDDDFTYKQDLVFEFFETAIGYSYKTTAHDLGYTVYTNNSVLVIFSTLEVSGDITLGINSNDYTIALLSTDTVLEIANKIKTAIQADWTVIITNGLYPVITITKSGVDDITTTFIDAGSTNINILVCRTYDGIMDEDLDIDEIELISLNMKKAHIEYLLKPLSRLQINIGTKDFNRLPNKVEEYKVYSLMLKDLEEEIQKFRQEFYSYSNT
jgi:hypothetical protein